MMHHPAEETLHMLVDAELTSTQAAETERHVADCAACQEYVARLERLRRAVAQVPREIVPPSHIEDAIRAHTSGSAQVQSAVQRAARTPQPHWRRSAVWMGIAAALACVIAAGVLVQQLRTGAPEEQVATADPDSHLLAELQDELERQRHLLSAETVVVVEQNLSAIDAAIIATQGALARDPSNSQLASMLEDTRRKRSDYIRSALDLASEI